MFLSVPCRSECRIRFGRSREGGVMRVPSISVASCGFYSDFLVLAGWHIVPLLDLDVRQLECLHPECGVTRTCGDLVLLPSLYMEP